MLEQFGELVMTDVCVNGHLVVPPGVQYRLADITHTDFDDNEFDLVVSSHVAEHIGELDGRPRLAEALGEIKRIAAPGALAAFTVPTSLWQLLNAPGQIWGKLWNIAWRVLRLPRRAEPSDDDLDAAALGANRPEDEQPAKTLSQRLRLKGHGVYTGFWEAVKAFRVAAWRERFREAGFEILCEQRLLCYGSAKWPVIWPNRTLAKLGLCTSYQFICKTPAAVAAEAVTRPIEYAPAYAVGVGPGVPGQSAEERPVEHEAWPGELICESSVQFEAEIANYHSAVAGGRDSSTTHIGRMLADRSISDDARDEFLAWTQRELAKQEQPLQQDNSQDRVVDAAEDHMVPEQP